MAGGERYEDGKPAVFAAANLLKIPAGRDLRSPFVVFPNEEPEVANQRWDAARAIKSAKTKAYLASLDKKGPSAV
jgi:hypothetical protein